MIDTKEKLIQCLKEEQGKYSTPLSVIFELFVLWLKGGEGYEIRRFQWLLRYYEYYLNKKKKYPGDWFIRLILKFLFNHAQRSTSIYIFPNQCDTGLRICHTGFRYFGNGTKIGRNCSVLPMVLIGMRDGTEGGAILGDDVDISTGVTILSPVKIGNNVRIGAGAVVTKEIPSNSIVAGIPAKVLRPYNKETDYFRNDNRTKH